MTFDGYETLTIDELIAELQRLKAERFAGTDATNICHLEVNPIARSNAVELVSTFEADERKHGGGGDDD